MTSSRLHLPGPTQRRIPVSLLAAEDMECGLSQVSGHGAHRSAMALALAQPPIELADMAVRAASMIHGHRIGGLDKSPLQVAIHIRASASVAGVAAASPSWQHGRYWTERDQKLLTDFGDLAHFREADLKLGPPAPGQDRVVFMGDSITQDWDLEKYFPGKPYINRGMSGQTSTQMLLRFRQDVIDLKPKVVVILAGTNDIAENTGPMPLSQTEGDLMSMAQLARANGIRVVLCSVLPSVRFPRHPQLKDPAPKIAGLNKWLKANAAGHGYVYVDYYSAMKDAAGGLPPNLSRDGVHPLPAGFAVMTPLAQAGIEKALK